MSKNQIVKGILLLTFLLSTIFFIKSEVFADTKTSVDAYAAFGNSAPPDGNCGVDVDGGYFVGDFSGDNKPDLAMLDRGGNLFIYLNQNISSGTTDLSADTNFSVKYTGFGICSSGNYSFVLGDVNNDGKNDLVVHARSHLDLVSSYYAFLSTTLDNYSTSEGTVVDITSTPTEYAFKISDGGGAYSMDNEVIHVVDIDDDNLNDIIYLTRDVFGSSRGFYYLDSTRFSSLPAGSTIDLTLGTSYTAYFTSSTIFTDNNPLKVGDVTNDGKPDIVWIMNDTSESYRGSINFLFGSQLAGISGTGNVIDVTNPTNISRKIWGVGNDRFFGGNGILIANLTGDSGLELVTTNALTMEVFGSDLMEAWEGSSGVVQNTGTNTVYSFKITSTDDGDWTLGYDHGIMGADINKNGLSDLIIVDWQSDDGCLNCGSIYVIFDSLLSNYFGLAPGSNSFAIETATNWNVKIRGNNGNNLGHNYGNSVNLTTDINSDGFADLIVGSAYMEKEFAFLAETFQGVGNSTGTVWNVNDATPAFSRVYDGIECSGCTPFARDITGDGVNDFVVGDYNNYAVYVFIGGSRITSVPAGYSIEKTNGSDITPSTYFPAGTQEVIIRANNKPVSLVTAILDGMGTDLAWSDITGQSDGVNGKSFVDLDEAPGIQGTHSLYIPFIVGSTGVKICPNALSLNEVSASCTGVVTMLEGAAGLSKVTIDGYSYWKVDGLTGTGGMNILSEAGLPDTGMSEMGMFVLSLISIVSGIVGYAWYDRLHKSV